MKTYNLQQTRNKHLFRVVDRDNNWTHYYHSPSKRYIRAVTYILDCGYAKGIGFQQYLLSKTKDEAKKILEKAGERGDRIHQFISKAFYMKGKVDRTTKVVAEDNVTGVTLSNDQWDAILAWAEFWNRHICVLIDYEYPVFNLKRGYGGTLDIIFRMTEQCGVRYCKCAKFIGQLGLGDWKSGGGLYPSFSAQNAAYANGENLGDVIGKNEIEFTAAVRIGTNHVTTGGCEVAISGKSKMKKDFGRFLAAKTIHDGEYKPFDPEKEIYEVPDTIEVVIKIERLIKPKPKKKQVKKPTETKLKKK